MANLPKLRQSGMNFDGKTATFAGDLRRSFKRTLPAHPASAKPRVSGAVPQRWCGGPGGVVVYALSSAARAEPKVRTAARPVLLRAVASQRSAMTNWPLRMAFMPARCEHGADLPAKLINGHRLLGEQRHLDALGCTAKSSRGNKLAIPSKSWEPGLRQFGSTRSTLTEVARPSPLASRPMAAARVRSGCRRWMKRLAIFCSRPGAKRFFNPRCAAMTDFSIGSLCLPLLTSDYRVPSLRGLWPAKRFNKLYCSRTRWQQAGADAFAMQMRHVSALTKCARPVRLTSAPDRCAMFDPIPPPSGACHHLRHLAASIATPSHCP